MNGHLQIWVFEVETRWCFFFGVQVPDALNSVCVTGLGPVIYQIGSGWRPGPGFGSHVACRGTDPW